MSEFREESRASPGAQQRPFAARASRWWLPGKPAQGDTGVVRSFCVGREWLILLICATGLIATAAFAAFAFERPPHLEDEVAYLFQARTMAMGRLTVTSLAP